MAREVVEQLDHQVQLVVTLCQVFLVGLVLFEVSVEAL